MLVRWPKESPKFLFASVATLLLIAGFVVPSLSAQPVSFTRTDVLACNNPEALAVDDFNGDGVPDLAVGCNPFTPGTGGVFIMLGNGDGTFGAPQRIGGSLHAVSVAAGDFNGDGLVDLVAVTTKGEYEIFLGRGDGTFQWFFIDQPGVRFSEVRVTDLNNDGRLDLVMSDPGSNKLFIALGHGDGYFGITRPFQRERALFQLRSVILITTEMLTWR